MDPGRVDMGTRTIIGPAIMGEVKVLSRPGLPSPGLLDSSGNWAGAWASR